MLKTISEIIPAVKIVKLEEFTQKAWIKKASFLNRREVVVQGLYYYADDKIKIYKEANDIFKISILIHELIHAAEWFGFSYKNREKIVSRKLLWRMKNIKIANCREELIAYMGQAILGGRLELPHYCQYNAIEMYKDYKNQLERLTGKKCSKEELIMLKDMAIKRIEIVNEHYYNFN